jgi:hypothetical protein
VWDQRQIRAQIKNPSAKEMEASSMAVGRLKVMVRRHSPKVKQAAPAGSAAAIASIGAIQLPCEARPA